MTTFRTFLAAPFFGIGIALCGIGMLFLAGGQLVNGDEESVSKDRRHA